MDGYEGDMLCIFLHESVEYLFFELSFTKDDMEGSVGGNVSLVGRLAIGMLGWFGS